MRKFSVSMLYLKHYESFSCLQINLSKKIDLNTFYYFCFNLHSSLLNFYESKNFVYDEGWIFLDYKLEWYDVVTDSCSVSNSDFKKIMRREKLKVAKGLRLKKNYLNKRLRLIDSISFLKHLQTTDAVIFKRTALKQLVRIINQKRRKIEYLNESVEYISVETYYLNLLTAIKSNGLLEFGRS